MQGVPDKPSSKKKVCGLFFLISLSTLSKCQQHTIEFEKKEKKPQLLINRTHEETYIHLFVLNI